MVFFACSYYISREKKILFSISYFEEFNFKFYNSKSKKYGVGVFRSTAE